jgi:signal transduction histidine kinase
VRGRRGVLAAGEAGREADAPRRPRAAPADVYGILALLTIPVSSALADLWGGAALTQVAVQLIAIGFVPVAIVAAVSRGRRTWRSSARGWVRGRRTGRRSATPWPARWAIHRWSCCSPCPKARGRAVAGLAVDRERLIVSLRASRARIAAAADDERRRIARDLHDGLQSRLVFLKIQAEIGAGAEVLEPASRARSTICVSWSTA